MSVSPLESRQVEMAAALEKLRANPRVLKIRISAPEECALGQSLQGVYDCSEVPPLPAEGCSRPGGCICTYEPILAEIYP
jgi:hypothetical protein